MTTICYMNGKMAADRKNTCRRKLNTYHVSQSKIFLSKCKRFCYAQTGSAFDEAGRLEFESNIAQSLEQYYSNPKFEVADIKELQLKTNWIMVMTKEDVFLGMWADQGMLGDTAHYYSFGSSEEYATTLMATGTTSFTDLYTTISRIDIGTSKAHTVYSQSELDSFKGVE